MTRAGADLETAVDHALPPEFLAHLRALGDACSDAIIGLDRAGRVTTFNRAATRLIGADVAPRRGSELDAAFVDRPRWHSLLTRAMSGEAIEGEPVDVVSAQGRIVPGRLALIPLRDRADGVVGATVAIRDLSENDVAQQTLARNERRVRRAEALAMIGSFVIDAALGSVQWSEGMYRVHGVTPDRFEVTLADQLALVHPEDRVTASSAIESGLAGEQPPSVDLRVMRPDGEQSWVSFAVEPLLDSAGAVLGVSGVCQDISARIASELALQDALLREQAVSEELRRIDKLKDEFLATVSHELRTPLTSIAGFAALLNVSAPEHHNLVERIERNALEMQRLIQGLLDQARLESGRMLLEPRSFPLAQAIREVLAEANLDTDGRVGVDVDDSIRVFLDRDSFSRILGNLIGNAVKYAPDSGVMVTAQVDGGFVIVSVADHGPGIALESQAGLFEPFYRAPDVRGTARGSGFGLAIVRRYVEVQGGRVWVDSEVGAGATFSFTVAVSTEDVSG